MNRRIVLSADDLSLEQLLPLVEVAGSHLYAVKIHDLYDDHGKDSIRWLKNNDVRVWIDAKLCDIPKTVALRSAVYKKHGADILTVHASGGVDMMEAAREHGPAEIYGITVLTSLDDDEVREIFNREIVDQVSRLSSLISKAGLNGIVCSPNELTTLKRMSDLGPDMKFVTPGIRSVGVSADDQQRIATPGQAVLNGSTYLVIGRQITKAKDPVLAIEQIEREIEEALSHQGR